MDSLTAPGSAETRFDRVAALVQARPARILAAVLAVHFVAWTLLPILVSPNLQLDLAEDLALGKEWQLGYWKHPPLPWWLADLAYRLVGRVEVVYVLGPLVSVAAMYFIWRLAREVLAPVPALVAVLALEGLHFFNLSAVKFSHDQMQLPFWALTGWLTYRAIAAGHLRDWVLAGVFLALAFWSKYAAFALAGTIGLFLLVDPVARRTWRTPGPYAMGAAFLLVLAPHLYWLVDAGFLPFKYVEARAPTAAHWYQHITYPLRWTASQVFFLLPAIALIATAALRSDKPSAAHQDGFAQRYIMALALGPFAITTIAAILTGRLPVAMWGYPLWCFAPLAAVMWFASAVEPARLKYFGAVFVLVFVAMPLAFVADELAEPFFRDRLKATQFPGRLVAATLTKQWREKTGTPLRYVIGAEVPPRPDERPDMGPTALGEFPANNVAVYSPDRPQVVVHGELALSPWINAADFAARGGVIVWLKRTANDRPPTNLATNFPTAEVQLPLSLRRQTLTPVEPVLVGYAFQLPRR